MNKKQPVYPFREKTPVVVEWDDSAANGRWSTREDYMEKARTNTGPIRSVGWINCRTAKVLQLIQSQTSATQDVADAITIPARCIRRIRRLKW